MATERLRFDGAFGDRLAARLELPAAEPLAFALFAHCFTCSKDLKAVHWISRALADRRIAVLRFDFTGLGESEGDFADTNFSSNLDDLRAAADFLRHDYQAPRLLIGHSLGGTAVLAVAALIPEAAMVATISAPAEPAFLRRTLLDAAPELTSQEEALVTLAGRRIRIRRQLLDDLAEHRMRDAIGNLGRPLIVFHSTTDEVVDIDHAQRIFAAARQPKSFIALDGTDHLLLRDERDARYVGAVLGAWAHRYM
ncbi:MAG: alpha/beta fold hydrolase [Dehalococcoidia bacterium]